jgi:PAS domain S-box-containing protein
LAWKRERAPAKRCGFGEEPIEDRRSLDLRSNRLLLFVIKSEKKKPCLCNQILMASGIRVLYVDDEPDLLEIGRLFLEMTGDFQVATSISGRDALDLPSLRSYDVVVSDYQMPGMDGIAFLKAFRERFEDIPFILFTGRGREEVVIEAINNGADFYIQKGGDAKSQFAELAHKIRQAYRRRAAERSLRDSERRLADIIDFLPDATFAIDSDGTVIAWNRAIEEMTGVPAHEMLGQGDFAYAVPFYGERRPVLIDRVDAPSDAISPFYTQIVWEGNTVTAESDLVRPRGHRISVMAKAGPLFNQEGGRIGAIETIRNITERRLLEEELAEKHEQLLISFEHLEAADERLRGQFDELVRSEQQLRTNEERFTMAQAVGQIGSWEYVLGTGELWGSSEMLRIFGLHEDSGTVPVREIEACIPERDLVHRSLVDLIQHGKDHHLVYVIDPADNSAPRTLRSVAHLETDANGNPSRVIGVVQDITEFKRMEKTLKDSELFLTSVIEQSPNPMGIFDDKGTLVRLNRACRTLFQVEPGSVGTYSILDDPRIEELGHSARIRNVFEAGETVTFQTTFEGASPSGASSIPDPDRALAITIFPVRDLSDQITHAVILYLDISEEREAEDALRRSEQKFMSLIQNASDMIRILDREGRIVYSSPSTLRHLGHDPADLSGRESFDEVHPDDRDRFRSALEEILEGANPGTLTEYRVRHADGHYVDVEAVTINLLDRPGIDGIVETIRPITERKEAEAHLHESMELFRAIFQNSPYPIAINGTPDFRFLEVNEAFLRVSGHTKEEVIGRNPVELGILTPPVAAKLFANRLRRGCLVNVPLILKGRDGRYLHVQFSTLPVTMQGQSALVTVIAETTKLDQVQDELVRANDELTTAISELRSVEQELRQRYEDLITQGEVVRASEEKFRIVVELSLDGLLIVDFEGNMLFANPAAARIVDLPEPDVLSRRSNVTEFVAPESRADLFHDLDAMAQGAEPYLSRYRIVTETGRHRWVECIGKRLLFEGEPSVLVSLRDVTERLQADAQLRESEQKFVTVFRNSPVPLVLISATDGRFVDVNHAFVRNTGFPYDRVIGERAEAGWLFADEGDVDRFKSLLREQKTVLGWEATYRTRSGEVRNCRVSAAEVTMDGVQHVLGLIDDITERKKIEEALRESEQRFRTLFENASDAITVHGFASDGRPTRFLNVNEHACDLMGYSREEMLSLSPMDVDATEPWSDGPDVMRTLMEKGDLVFERLHIGKDGRTLPVEVSAHIFIMEGQRVVISIIRDITERKRAEDALRQANKKLNILSGITRHDIRNRLLALDGYVELLDPDLPEETFGTFVSRIKIASAQIAAMIQFTREYEQVGVQAPIWQNVRALADRADRDAAPGEVTVINDLPRDLELYTDPLIVKVFFTLVENAVRHGDGVPRVRFSCEESEGSLTIVCEDDGKGIAPGEKERIFELGFGRNTGFGLAISRDILDITGLSIREVGEYGQGARFEIAVPNGVFRRVE